MQPCIHFCPDELRAAMERMNAVPVESLSSIEAITAQAELEVAIRKLIVSFPNELFSGDRCADYLAVLRSELPPENIVQFLKRKQRILRVTEDQSIDIERRQGARCKWCGALLSAQTKPHLDHVFPLAFGGDDTLENLQLLCSTCNQGKGDLIHWVMGAPWFRRRSSISARMRYCVLGKFRSRCAEPMCDNDSGNSELHVDLTIPRSSGGSKVFDNLSVYCEEHLRIRRARNEAKVKTALRSIRMLR